MLQHGKHKALNTCPLLEKAPLWACIFILFIAVEAFLLKTLLFFLLKERARIQVLGFSML